MYCGLRRESGIRRQLRAARLRKGGTGELIRLLAIKSAGVFRTQPADILVRAQVDWLPHIHSTLRRIMREANATSLKK